MVSPNTISKNLAWLATNTKLPIRPKTKHEAIDHLWPLFREAKKSQASRKGRDSSFAHVIRHFQTRDSSFADTLVRHTQTRDSAFPRRKHVGSSNANTPCVLFVNAFVHASCSFLQLHVMCLHITLSLCRVVLLCVWCVSWPCARVREDGVHGHTHMRVAHKMPCCCFLFVLVCLHGVLHSWVVLT